MKVLGWMHRKLMHNGIEVMKNSTIGNASTCFPVQPLFDEQNYYTEPTKALSHSNIISRKPSNGFEGLYQEESFEPFDFLSIGTFGMELLNTDPSTPTLPMPIEEMTGDQIEITENDLDLINYNLGKFLEAEEAETQNDTSQRSSQASVITLSYKTTEGAESEGHMHMVSCPLQNYLFAASVELAEMDKEKKKERTSLGELFMRNNIVHDDPPQKKCRGSEKQAKKGNLSDLMKKVVNKFHPSEKQAKDSAASSNPFKKKLSKTLHKMLNKKVYPEEMIEKRANKLSKRKKKSSSDDDHNNKFDESSSKESKKKLSLIGICRGASPVNAGHWIRTDSDYLVLEL